MIIIGSLSVLIIELRRIEHRNDQRKYGTAHAGGIKY